MPKRKAVGKAPRRAQATSKSRYVHDVPPAREILRTLEAQGVPLDLGQLATLFSIRDDKTRKALRQRLQKMVGAGQLLINRRAEYCLLDKIDAVSGTVSAHPDGFGFVIPEDGSPDVYLSYAEMRPLLDGDRVTVRVRGTSRGGKLNGELLEILQRGKAKVVGAYNREHGVGYIIESGRVPHSFVVPDHHRGDAKPGDLVKAEILEYPTAHREGQAKIVHVFGDADDPSLLTDIALEQFGIRHEWPAKAMAEAAGFGDAVADKDKQGDRADLRDLPLVTIDGADARDFDDAVFAEPAGDDWRLVVAIADVSHYVAPGSELDREARRRGTSVYFADRVVPMLPESLSNGLCSLNPDVDRLCMVCDMVVDAQGKTKRSRFYRGVMRSVARLTYTAVDELHTRGKPPRGLPKAARNSLDHLYSVYRCLAKARRRRGALDLDLPEVKIELGDDGRIASISPRERNDAHRLIEECMIAANVEAASFLSKRRLANLYRVHAGPDPDRFEELRLLLQSLGFKVPEQALTEPKHLNAVLRGIAERPDAATLSIAVLRSLNQAVYQPKNLGHYGLGLSRYAHFTSPIRRYPDLVVHRGIGHLIDGGLPRQFAIDTAGMEQLGQQCSTLERQAEEATRYVEARLKCLYIQDYIGETFSGIVGAIKHFGLFVTLESFPVDGLVHVSTLGRDYFHCEDGGSRMVGERTGEAFTLGQRVEVTVLRVDVEQAKVDLELSDSADRTTRRRRR